MHSVVHAISTFELYKKGHLRILYEQSFCSQGLFLKTFHDYYINHA